MPDPVVEAVGLKKYFPIRGGVFRREIGSVRAVDGVELTIFEGETLGLVGESGCGKTTVGRSMLALIGVTDGAVYWKLPPSIRPEITALWGEVRAKEAMRAEGRGDPAALKAEIRRLRTRVREVGGPHDLSNLSKREVRALRREMQIVFQDPFSSLNPRMIVRDIIGEPLQVHKIRRWWCPNCHNVKEIELEGGDGGIGAALPAMRCDVCGESMVVRVMALAGRALRDRVTALLAQVGLNPEHVYRFPHEFSGGQRQRIGVARALALNPHFIVLDEPTSALDVSVQAQILNLLKDLQRERHLTYLFISHHLAVVRHISDRVAVMYLGKIAEYAPTEELFSEPLHPYTKALLSAVPIPDPDVPKERIILKGDVPSPASPPAGCRFHPRCPVAFERCGWTPDEILKALDVAFRKREDAGAMEPRLVQSVTIEGNALRLACNPGSEGQVRTFLDRVLAEDGAEFRGFRAIASVVVEGTSVLLSTHGYEEPQLKEVRPGHEVSCHLF